MFTHSVLTTTEGNLIPILEMRTLRQSGEATACREQSQIQTKAIQSGSRVSAPSLLSSAVVVELIFVLEWGIQVWEWTLIPITFHLVLLEGCCHSGSFPDDTFPSIQALGHLCKIPCPQGLPPRVLRVPTSPSPQDHPLQAGSPGEGIQTREGLGFLLGENSSPQVERYRLDVRGKQG